MTDLTDFEQKIVDLVRQCPEIAGDAVAMRRAASEIGVSEDDLRVQITELKHRGLISDRDGPRDDSDILVVARVLFKMLKRTLANFVTVCLVFAVLSLNMPKTFRVTATIIPPAPQQNLGMLNAITSALPLGGLGFGQMDYESMTLLVILNSRTVKEDVIKKFNLMKFYDVETMEDALETLGANTLFDFDDEGTISITADVSTGWFSGEEEDDQVKQLATDIANFFIADLDSVNKKLKTEQARFQRIFLEKRHNENIRVLKEAENMLKTFQEEHRVVSLPDQTRAAIEAAAAIEIQIQTNEIRLEVLEKTISPAHPEIERVRNEISGLKSKLTEMQAGSRDEMVFPGFSEIPDLTVQLLRLKRDVEIQNALFAFLTQQYEEAKIQEAKDTPTLQVVDWAVKPEKKHEPNRAIFVIFFSFLSIVLTSLYIIYKPAFAALRIP